MNLRYVLLHTLLFVLVFLSPAQSRAQSSAQIVGTTKPQIEAIQAEKANRSPAQQKMSSHLIDALKQRDTGTVVASAPNLKPSALTYSADGNVVVDIKARVSDGLIGEIERLGGKVMSQFPQFNAVRASIPLDNIEALAGHNDVLQVIPAAKARTNQGPMEGDIAHMGNIARATFNVAGAGVRVGVISDSIDDGYGALDNAITVGAIDRAKLSVLQNQAGEGDGEGLAMAEIVHAIAPGAQIIFATGMGSPAQMAANILALADKGCQIIVDDLTYFNESPFQDGPISEAVEQVSAKGVLYFSSARNSGNKKQGTSGTWEGDFEDGGAAGVQYGVPNGRIHVFGMAGDKRITLNTVDKARPSDRVDLFWSDPLEGATNEYDLFVVDKNGQVVRSSTSNQNGTQDPYQSVEVLKPGESIVIVKAAGAAGRFLHLDTGRATLRYSTSGSVRGHNASGASNAFSVAARRVPSPATAFAPKANDSVDSYSSDGPRRMFFRADGKPVTPGNFSSAGGIVLNKPDITAAAGVTTSNSQFAPFLGTSAAAPHAAAIAALLLSCNPRPSGDQIRSALTGSTLALDGATPNVNAGFGIVMASGAARNLCKAPPPVPATASSN